MWIGAHSPYVINLQLMAIDDVHLLENIVDIPDLNRSINRRCNDTVPVADS